MKKIFTSIIMLVTTCVGILSRGANINIQQIESIVDQYVDQFTILPYTTQDIQTVLNKISVYQHKGALSENTQYGLTYLQQQVTNLLVNNDGATNIESDTLSQTLNGIMIDTSNYKEGEIAIVAGRESPPVMKLSYTAILEGIVIEDLEISGSENLGQLIKTLSIYSSTGSLVYAFSPSSTSQIIDNINLSIPKGTRDFYVTITPHAVGQYELGRQFEDLILRFKVIKAVGQITNDTISTNGNYQTSNNITILPVKIATVNFVEDAYGYKVPIKLTQGRNNLAILQISADQRDNTRTDSSKPLHMLIDTITVTLQDGTKAQNVSDQITIKRLDRGDGIPISGDLVGANIIDFDISAGNYPSQLIKSGETAYFLIRGYIEIDTTSSEYLKISLGENTPILYTTDDPTAIVIDTLYLTLDEIPVSTLFSY